MRINNRKMERFKIMSHQCHNRGILLKSDLRRDHKIIYFGIQRKNKLMGHTKISDAGHIYQYI